jgi:hypothetical protein
MVLTRLPLTVPGGSVQSRARNKNSRLQQILEWLEPKEDFNGVLAFDESHRAKNLTLDQAERRSSKTAYVRAHSR